MSQNNSGHVGSGQLTGFVPQDLVCGQLPHNIFQSGYGSVQSGMGWPYGQLHSFNSGVIGERHWSVLQSGGVVQTEGGKYYPASGRIGWVCRDCGFAHLGEGSVTVTGVSGLYVTYCQNCAGFNWPEDRGFGKAERLLREFTNDPPWQVVADWCEENGRQPDAEWIRKYRCGK